MFFIDFLHDLDGIIIFEFQTFLVISQNHSTAIEFLPSTMR